MLIIATICSRKKKDDVALVAAQERYLGLHINSTRTIAENAKLPFFILSGKYGLIRGEELIPDYDYLLSDDAVSQLSLTVADQLRAVGATSIEFYTEGNPNWKAYERTVEEAAKQAGVRLQICSVIST